MKMVNRLSKEKSFGAIAESVLGEKLGLELVKKFVEDGFIYDNESMILYYEFDPIGVNNIDVGNILSRFISLKDLDSGEYSSGDYIDLFSQMYSSYIMIHSRESGGRSNPLFKDGVASYFKHKVDSFIKEYDLTLSLMEKDKLKRTMSKAIVFNYNKDELKEVLAKKIPVNILVGDLLVSSRNEKENYEQFLSNLSTVLESQDLSLEGLLNYEDHDNPIESSKDLMLSEVHKKIKDFKKDYSLYFLAVYTEMTIKDMILSAGKGDYLRIERNSSFAVVDLVSNESSKAVVLKNPLYLKKDSIIIGDFNIGKKAKETLGYRDPAVDFVCPSPNNVKRSVSLIINSMEFFEVDLNHSSMSQDELIYTDETQVIKRVGKEYLFGEWGYIEQLSTYAATVMNIGFQNYTLRDIINEIKPYGYSLNYVLRNPKLIVECVGESLFLDEVQLLDDATTMDDAKDYVLSRIDK